MRNKYFRITMVALVLSAFTMAGCETAGGSAGLGAGIGALAGGIIGNQSGHALEGAAIGALVGAAAGFIVHDVKTRRARTAQQTVSDYNYTPDQGFKLDMKSSSVSPGTVTPGGTVTTTTQYATLGTGSGVPVAESCILKKDGKELTKLDEKTVQRTDGTWENVIQFKVPKNADAGPYVVAQNVSASGQSFQRDLAFNVNSATAQLPQDNAPAPRVEIAAAE